MVYFFINLFLHLLLSAALLLLILKGVSNNQKRRNKKGIAYLLPAVLTLFFLILTVSYSAPRLMDSVYVVKKNFQTTIGEVESVGYLNHLLVIDGNKYYYNPFLFKPQAGDTLEISYTPYAQYIMVLALVE